MTNRIGFIGVGIMGHGLAKNIVQAGYPLTFLDHPGNQPVEDLYRLGAVSRDNVGEIVKYGDIVLICVTGSPQVEEVVLGPNEFLAGLDADKIVIDCSTVEPQVTRHIATEIERTGARFLDAPLTRTPKEAELGKANTMVGGDASVLQQVRPVLETFTENIYHAGPVGTGATLKLLHNFVSLGNCALLAEAVTTARKSGVDIDTFIEVLTTGGGDSTALKRLTPFILNGDVGGLRFSIANSAKDTGYYRSLTNQLAVPAMVAESVHRVFEQADSSGMGDRPVAELITSLFRE